MTKPRWEKRGKSWFWTGPSGIVWEVEKDIDDRWLVHRSDFPHGPVGSGETRLAAQRRATQMELGAGVITPTQPPPPREPKTTAKWTVFARQNAGSEVWAGIIQCDGADYWSGSFSRDAGEALQQALDVLVDAASNSL